ncbi:MAG: ParB/RepB/Spo0J family partition protein [Ruminococcaceae bacterium]|nr:ParB/RepB/Spo0J family partition protein [Oscillospiraceae bacterium]
MAKKGLGKGLGSLISVSEEVNNEGIVEIKLTEIEPNKEQPREVFDEEKLIDLAESIKEHGVISPIIVKKEKNGYYKIIAGERRWRASKMAKISTIPAIIKDFEDEKAYEIALIENLQRQDLNPIEEAKGYKRLMEEFNLTQEAVSQKVSKARSQIANSLRLLNLPKAAFSLLESGKISVGHAKVLLSIENTDRIEELAELVAEKGITVRELEKLVSSSKRERKEKKEDLDTKLAFIDFEKRASDTLGTKVKIHSGKKKGKIEIEYYGYEDLERIFKIIENS